MSSSQSFANSYYNNHVLDDSSTVFDADTVVPDEVPSRSTTEYPQQPNTSSPHRSQDESPANTISELLRRINSTRTQHRLAVPSPSTITTATAATTKEICRRNQHQSSLSSSSSKKRPIKTNSSSNSSRKQTRRSSRLKRKPDQSYVDKSDSEVEDENGLEEAVSTNQSSSTTTKDLTKHELKWMSRFEELCAFKQLYGHTSVAQKSQDYRDLGEWVKCQRVEYKKFKANKKTYITNERIKMLESIYFEWVGPMARFAKDESAWNKKFTELKDYKEKHGHTKVPQRCNENKQLGNWVRFQRQQYKNFQMNGKRRAKISPERIQMLNSIGFQWECLPGRPPQTPPTT